MRLEYINRVKENEILAKNIYTDDGRILLRAGISLTDQYIRKLNSLGVYYVFLEDSRLDDVPQEDDKLIILKQEAIKSLKNITRNIGILDKSATKDCLCVVDNLIDYILELGDVNESLYDIKTHDNYTFLHSLDTGIMSAFLGVSLNMKKESLKELTIGAILHDIGKIKIPSSIINKRGPLTDEEFAEMKKHPIYGRQLLEKNLNISSSSILGVEQHHEKVNGRGYPYGLEEHQILRYGKVIGLCDVYDAISSDRSYRKKFGPNEAYELILAEAGTSFDKNLVNYFKQTFSVYPLGCCVRLSNKVEAYVIRQNKNFPDRPVVRVLYDHVTKKPVKFYEIDMLHNLNLTIEEVI